jgi:arylsulfatase A-like enzyme
MWDGLYEGKYKLPHAKPVPSRYWHPCVWQNGRLLETGPGDFGPDLYTNFVIDFMKRQKKAERPFLAYFPMKLPHTIAPGGLPTTPTEGRPGSNRGGNLRKCNAYIDLLVGRIVQALDKEGLREHTILLFTSDNGGYPFGKMWATEYGARVPLVVNGPGYVKARPATDVLTEFSDILPTLLDFAGVQLPEGYELDGRSLMPFLSGRTNEHRDWVYSYIGTARMIRDQRWLLEGVDPIGGTPQGRLYDCGEKRSGQGYTEVADSDDPEVAEARQRLQSILAAIPHLDPDNPDYGVALDSYKRDRYHHKVR